MGLFDKIFGSNDSNKNSNTSPQRLINPWGGYGSNQLTPDFIRTVAASDRGEEWAQKLIEESGDSIPMEEFSLARLEVYYETALNGDEDALHYIGFSLAAFNPEESIQILTELADKGVIKSMRALAMNYGKYGYYGNDEEKEFQWLLKAAKAGSGMAQAQIGLKYTIKGNHEEAEKWYEMSADNGNSEGAMGLADCYGLNSTVAHDENVANEYRDMQEQLLLSVWNQFFDDRDDKIEEVSIKLGLFYRYSKKDFNEAMKYYYFATKFSQVGKEHGETKIKEIEDEKGIKMDIEYKNEVDSMFS